MGRRRTAEEYNRTAEENGWVLGAYVEEDSIQLTKDEPAPRLGIVANYTTSNAQRS